MKPSNSHAVNRHLSSSMLRILCFLACLLCYGVPVLCQTLTEIAKKNHPGWVEFREELELSPNGLFSEHKALFQLGNDDAMVLSKTKVDRLGMEHHTFQQYHKGVQVSGANFTLHSSDSIVKFGTGLLVSGLDLSVSPSIDSSGVIAIALTAISQYEAQRGNVDTSQIVLVLDSTTTIRASLLIAKAKQDSSISANYFLAYRVRLSLLSPANLPYVLLIDATTGAVVHVEYDLTSDTGNGVVPTLYNGSHNVVTTWGGEINQWRLIDNTRGSGIETKKGYSNQTDFIDVYINDEDNIWDDNMRTKASASVHWAVEMAWDYFASTLTRNGIDNEGMGVHSMVYYDDHSQLGNLSFVTASPLTIFIYGSNENQTWDPVSLNRLGHEFTHGLLHHDAGWSTGVISANDESYALMEGYCDLFAECIQYWVEGSVDWMYAAETFINQSLIRKFSPPILNGQQAMEYGDSRWIDNPSGRHRSGVLMHLFYLISVGDEGINYQENLYCIDGIGIEKAADIMYDALDGGYLNTSSTYATLREATLAVASQRFGPNSNEVAQLTQAWYATCVGPEYNDDIHINGLTVGGSEHIARNHELFFSDLQNGSGNSFIVSSAERITMNSTSKSFSGSYFHAFIAPACEGSAKTDNSSNQQSQPNPESQIVDSAHPALYPNPTTGLITYTATAPLGSATVMDLTGRTLHTVSLNGAQGPVQVDLSPYRPGTYLLRVQYQSGKVEVHRVVRQ